MFYWLDLINLKPIYKDLSFKRVSRKVYAGLIAKVIVILDINRIWKTNAR
jgi:hypothetical protein